MVATDEDLKGKTLWGTLRELDELSWELNNLIFGERPTTEPKHAEEVGGDVVSNAKVYLEGIIERLRDVKEKLRILGN